MTLIPFSENVNQDSQSAQTVIPGQLGGVTVGSGSEFGTVLFNADGFDGQNTDSVSSGVVLPSDDGNDAENPVINLGLDKPGNNNSFGFGNIG
ncbi:MAG: hypothetical protein AAGD25_24470 [Cyanobacteria bacterium P01_F01_bin.150]